MKTVESTKNQLMYKCFKCVSSALTSINIEMFANYIRDVCSVRTEEASFGDCDWPLVCYPYRNKRR